MNSPLESRNNPTAWDALLQKALPALDFVFRSSKETPDWTLGGGTALALRIAHRLSDDIDIFVPYRPLKYFTPRLNKGARNISTRYQWPGHYLKYECDGGEIDFLSAQLQTEPGFTWETYRHRRIALETPAEIVVKKVRFRAAQFTARDIFDVAAVARRDEGLATLLASETPDALPRLKVAVVARGTLQPDLSRDVRPTAAFRPLVETAFADVLALIERASALAR